MKVKTSEATELQLDWGVAVATNKTPFVVKDWGLLRVAVQGGGKYFDHTDPAVCMSLIKEYCIQLYPFCDGEIVRWDADIRPDVRIVNCDTPEQAVARCVISMKLGDEFECPSELGVMS